MDAETIYEASLRPTKCLVTVNTKEQQAREMLFRTCDLPVGGGAQVRAIVLSETERRELEARMERNVTINCRHLQLADLEVSLETPVWWDQRLFPTACNGCR